jgi:hypothetical protein
MRDLLVKILIFSLFFLFTSAFAAPFFNTNFGPQVYENLKVPIILPRAIWENTANLKNLLDWYPEEASLAQTKENSPPDYFSIDRIIIHDMGCDVKHLGCNDKKLNPLTIIQNIYRYHAVTRGWGDIGYHFIIDYWGNVYEGRYGGNGVRGAHTYYDRKCNNFNVGSVGILLMGNYEKVEPSEVMYKSLARLIAWIAITNDLDPKELNHTSEIWHSPKKAAGCDLSQGGLTSTYIGPVVVGHGDVEKGNSDPGLANLNRVRRKANELLSTYKNYLYTTKEDSKIYSIKDGVVSLVKPSSFKKAIILNKNQFYAFPSSLKKKYSDGILVKSYTRDRVYLIAKNKRRAIFSEKLFKLKSYNWKNVVSLSDRDLAVYSLGTPLTYPDKSLIKGDGPEVYLIENDTRRHITSVALFENRKFKWGDVIKITQAELLAHPLGEKFLLSDGTLVKENKLHPIYLIKNKKRHWIETLEVFLGLDYKWKDIITLSSQEISYYGVGLVIGAIGDLLNLEDKKESKETKETKDIKDTGEPNIRIGIYEVPVEKSVKIRADGPYEVYKNGILLANKKANEIIVVPYSETDSYKFLPFFTKATEGGPASESVIFEIISYEDHPKWNPELNDNHFRGIVEIKYSPKSEKLWVINELSLEDYLKGVAEALNNDPIEYLKAFAVVARSYALFHIQNKGKISGEIFHLKNWAFDQLYKGYEFEKRAPNITKAVEETKGLVATYNNKPIRGVYSSDSGGVTKSACEIFKGVFCDNEDYAYLKGEIKDPDGTIHTQTAIIASHGVGMSSAGARRLAEMGKTFEEILKYYYLEVETEEMY